MNKIQANPSLMWDIFSEINQVPRPSKKEELIVSYLYEFATKHQLDFKQDKVGNVLITKKGTQEGYVLQSHMDMVCEKNPDSTHDFDKDAIQTYQEDGFIKARGTTLGADDGIGMAMSLAALLQYQGDKTLEALFTVDEEIGLIGASEIEPNFFASKSMINLDSEEDGVLYVGCAGGVETSATFKLDKQAVIDDAFFVKISVSGLLGGHSGEDIHQKRANAIRLLQTFLVRERDSMPVYLHSFDGGTLHNAITREAYALFCVPFKYREQVRVDWNIYVSEMEEAWMDAEKSMRFDLGSYKKQDYMLSQEQTDKILQAIEETPHGVIAMSQSLANTVETSSNLATVKMQDDNLVIATSQRSIIDKNKDSLAFSIFMNYQDLGATGAIYNPYNGWTPNFASPLLAKAQQVWQETTGKEAHIKVVHAGLECGLFLNKYPYLDVISVGPTILGVHSPSERLDIASSEKTYQFLLNLLHQQP